ncbi:phosphodiester glycosidase family protein [Chitinophaga filiformis]|uniref:Uncharacterized protein YigE, DUF2233 family n=1 Tax=Chitinophaga filiformis TaxID=104663 RepID=A0A1G8CRZ4_CHIFI|nr:phosphodiester glycosidase family protein [Chitinophaga filiformis]SDH48208.1 Uncharacterized protein YigE, DUF2233 family [Chitinophaga filiformis]
MKRIFLSLTLVLLTVIAVAIIHKTTTEDNIVSYTVDPKVQDLRFYWKDDKAQFLGSIQHLKELLAKQHRKLVFATNGGMFKPDQSPVGLFIREQVTETPLDTSSGNGNFYLKPNGVLYITKEGKANICTTPEFKYNRQIWYATQSGPMLLIDGDIHPAFKKGSVNVNIRNGVGLLPDGRLVFAMSKSDINFYDFADYFKRLGCKQALYLDGFVSRTYLPAQNWIQTDGNFGVIVGVSEPE